MSVRICYRGSVESFKFRQAAVVVAKTVLRANEKFKGMTYPQITSGAVQKEALGEELIRLGRLWQPLESLMT